MYQYNKRAKTNKLVLLAWGVLGLSIGLYIGMRLFMWGFERGSL